MEARASTVAERLAFVASADALRRSGVRLEDLVDPDARAIAIRADHLELVGALRQGEDEVVIEGEPVSVRLHLVMHEIVANQLADDDPPEVFQTACRLRDAGYDRHEVLHMLAAPVVGQIFGAFANDATYDPDKHLAELRALPGSWERRRRHRTLARTDPQGRHARRRRRR
jgi:hypothetical protein